MRALVVKLLKYHYGITVSNIKQINMGHNKCFIANDDINKYFLKILPNEEENKFIDELNYIAYITPNFCTPKIIQADLNKKYIACEYGLLLVEKYEEGTVYNYNECPSPIMRNSAVLLGKLNMISKNYKGKRVLDFDWIVSFRKREIQELNSLINRINHFGNNAVRNQLKSELTLKLEMSEFTSRYESLFRELTFGMSHGDYCCPQWITQNNQIICIIDFTNCSEVPYVWEVFRSYLQSAISCKSGTAIDINELIDYILAYNTEYNISLIEWLKMPFVYCCWLSASTYGYKQYISGQGDDYLKIVSWRTKMCRTVLQNADQIIDRIKENINE